MRFTSLPPILYLKLKRIQYNFKTDKMEKYNKKYKFTEKLNLEKFCGVNSNYNLYGVIAHTGISCYGAHRSFFKVDTKWLCFDDTRVFQVEADVAINKNFGGVENNHLVAMELIYICDNEYDKLMKPITNMHNLISNCSVAYFDKRINKIDGPIR